MPRALRVAAVFFVVSGIGACSSSGGGSGNPPRSVASTPGSSQQSPSTTARVGAARGADWATYYGDAARTGRASDGPAPADRAHKQWSSPTLDGTVYAQPLVVGRRIFVATEKDTV